MQNEDEFFKFEQKNYLESSDTDSYLLTDYSDIDESQ